MMMPGPPERRTHDYSRHGTMLFCGIEHLARARLSGSFIDDTALKEFLSFFRTIDEAVPRVSMCIWSWTTTGRTKLPRSKAGSLVIRAFTALYAHLRLLAHQLLFLAAAT
jgi:hypothetical protein